MFAYDLIKRQKCVITIGTTMDGQVNQALEKVRTFEGKQDSEQTTEQAFDEVKKTAEAKQIRDAINIPCYFLNVPQIQFSQSFNSYSDQLSGSASALLSNFNKGMGALGSMLGSDTIDIATDAVAALSQQYKGPNTGQGTKKDFNIGKGMAAGHALNHIKNNIMEAGTTPTSIYQPGNIIEWAGASPVSFSIDVLFVNKTTGVHMGVLYPLMEACGFSDLLFGNIMKGPRGFQSMGLGFQAIKEILLGNIPQLHSLQLWYDNEDNFNTHGPYRTTVLNLYRLLVIESLNIQKPNQLFFDPMKPDIPLYKWIKATIAFKTACPVPGSYFLGTDFPNASMHDFYGDYGAVGNNVDKYSAPIDAAEKDRFPYQGRDDMYRLSSLNGGGS